MMVIRLTLFIALTFLLIKANGQQITGGGAIGYGVYSLTELNELQNQLAENYEELQIKEVEEFPAYVNYSAFIELNVFKNTYIGANAAFYSTGARNHLADYSGEYKLDMPIKSTRIGGHFRVEFAQDQNLKFDAKLAGGIIKTKLKMVESFQVYDVYSDETTYNFKANNMFIEPSLGLNYEIIKHIVIFFNAGYEFDFKCDNLKEQDEDFELKNKYGDNVHADWSGIRINGGLYFYL